ncbi:acyl-CoA synthetase [Thermoplasma sp. Kam2015]|uniref:AMP-binding protein n=1 Tax=Thermoplasma sp. Kam2015 TaxID=2094122 RepID=UPI000D9C16E1|nr:AMP-binding protein [Thermoplasma sp. Kam2015]PYB68989.1 acyl-CoA synthetase [Thermoplasma sp. Kam2015]
MFYYRPSDEIVSNTNLGRFANSLGISVKDLYRRADNDPEWFWPRAIDDLGIEFFRKYDRVVDLSDGVEWARWFTGGEINIEFNAVERYSSSGKTAIIYEAESGENSKLSYSELNRKVSSLASTLLDLGIRKGDRVAVYMPFNANSAIAFYSILRIGAVAVPMFSGYGLSAVRGRIEDSGAKLLITSRSYERKGKSIDMAGVAEKISIKTIMDGDSGKFYRFEDAVSGSKNVETERTGSEDPAIMLYTSGTTGKPKGTVHVHGGALVNIAKEVKYYMDLKEEDVLHWITDLGWMMGPWALIGTNALHGTILLYDGAIDYPEPDRLFDIAEKNRVTILGLSPTVVRMIKYRGTRRTFDTVRVFGSTGEPWDEESWVYLFNVLGRGRASISNISGGTDIIGCFLASNPAVPQKPKCLYRGLGMNASIFNEQGQEVYNTVGYLVAKYPSPSMTRGLWNNREKYLETYWSRFKGIWFHGDFGEMDEDGYFYLYGRSDDVIKIAGKRVGPNEVEDLVMRVDGVTECAVVSIPDRIKGEVIAVFYVGDPGLNGRIEEAVENGMGKPFRPSHVFRISKIPKTRNGKIMRRVIRSAFCGLPMGDISNTDDTEVIREIEDLGKMTLD